MTSIFKTLYEGQLPDVATVLGTVPAGKNWIIKHMSVINNDAADQTFALYRRGTTAPFIFTPPDTLIVAGGMYEFTGTLTLEAGATIAGIASLAAALTLIFDGDEVTL